MGARSLVFFGDDLVDDRTAAAARKACGTGQRDLAAGAGTLTHDLADQVDVVLANSILGVEISL